MKIDLNPSDFNSKEQFVRAALEKARNAAHQAWDEEFSDRSKSIEKEVAALSKTELTRRLVKLLSRSNRARAVIDESTRSKAKNLRKKGLNVKEIAVELGISIPSVYNITKG